MIQQLLVFIQDMLLNGFSGQIEEENIRLTPIDQGQVPTDGPAIGLYIEKLTYNTGYQDADMGEPRPEEVEDSINVVDGDNSYSLTRIPLTGYVTIQLFYNFGEPTQRRLQLKENIHYRVNYENGQVDFGEFDLTGVDLFIARYAIPGVFNLKEFQQEFSMEIYTPEVEDLERVASLAVSIITTQQAALLDQYNTTSPTTYQTVGPAPTYSSTHTISSIRLKSGEPDYSTSTPSIQLRFSVIGSIRYSRTIGDTFGIIERIHSTPGVNDGPIINIVPELD